MIADAAATIFLVCPVQEVQKIAKTLEVEFLIVFDDMSSIQSPNFPLFINK
jgi:thiamine biosynthesis lipoprotein ApbE